MPGQPGWPGYKPEYPFMKAIYLLLILAPIYLILVLGDFLNEPMYLLMPACVLLVVIWQVAAPMIIKRVVAPSLLNLVGGACALGSFIYGWVIILGAGLPEVSMAIALVIWTGIGVAGFGRMLMRYEKDNVSITAAGGLSLVLSGLLVWVLKGITGEALAVFFSVSLAPLTLVLFFYSMTILMKRPEAV
jgi:multidrug transporter EmrE-like cation transporter